MDESMNRLYVYKTLCTESEPAGQYGFHKFSRDWEYRTTACKYVSDWPTDMHVDIETRGSEPEDLPWYVGSATFASKRFCDLVREMLPPEEVQFLPVYVTFDGKETPESRGSYEIVNWLREVDCLDKELSGFHYHPKFKDFPVVNDKVIDLASIPLNAMAFRVKYCGSGVIIRDDFVQAMRDRGITGWWLMDLLTP